MTLDALIILAGSLVAALPFLGFPNSWDTVMFFVLGVFIIGLGIVVRRRSGEKYHPQERNGGTFVENGPRSGVPHDT